MSSPTLSAETDNTTSQQFAAEIVRRQGLFATSKRKLIAALIASLIAHFIAGLFAQVELVEEKSTPITAKFMKLPPPPAPTPVAQAAPPKPKPKPRPKPQPAAVAATLPVQAESPIAVPASEPAVEKSVEPVAPVAPIAEPTPTPPVVAEAPPAPPPERMPPQKIELAYIAYLGEQKFEVGPVNMIFTHKEGRYKLRVTGRGRGLAALLYPGTFTGESEGTITAEGLRPDRFIEERGNPDKRREIVFDHASKTVKVPEKEPIAIDGAPHDPLTWIVQFYFAMPKGVTTTFSVASSRKVDAYTLERTGDEKIQAPTGDVDPQTGKRATTELATQVWKGARKPDAEGKGGGSAQFWVAPEWNYVPFKIKVVSAQGRSASFELTGVNAE